MLIRCLSALRSRFTAQKLVPFPKKVKNSIKFKLKNWDQIGEVIKGSGKGREMTFWWSAGLLINLQAAHTKEKTKIQIEKEKRAQKFEGLKKEGNHKEINFV